MTFARLTMIPALTTEVANQLNIDLTDLIANGLGKKHELTSVLIETPSEGCWTIGAENQKPCAHLEVCVTTGTNSEDEKRAFVANDMSLLRQVAPKLAKATYVVVTELPASNWGYDGVTQADRAKQSQ